MSYRNVDSEAYKKQYAKKKKSKKTSSKLDKIPSGSIDQRVQTYRMRKKKKYTKESMFPKAREEARKNIAKPRPFGEAFRSAKDAGKKAFLWKGKSYHTKTKDELEKATKERSERYAKAKKESIPKEATPKKKGFFSKIATKLRGGHETQAGYEEAKAKRIKAKRIAKMEKRKEEGKSYSAKNLAALKGSEPKSTYIAKKKKPSYSISS